MSHRETGAGRQHVEAARFHHAAAVDEFDHVVHNVDIDEAAAELGALIE